MAYLMVTVADNYTSKKEQQPITLSEILVLLVIRAKSCWKSS